MKEIEFKISRFVDGELPLEEQGEFFKTLSLDEDARKILNEFTELKRCIKEHYSGLDINLSSLKVPMNKEPINKYKKYFYFSAAAVILILLSSSFFISDLVNTISILNSVQENYINTKSEIERLKKEKDTFKTILAQETNQSKSRIKTAAIKNEDKEKANYIASYKIIDEKRTTPDVNNKDIQIIQITKADFLTTQMIGN